MGVSLSSIFLVFTGQSITQIFFVTAATFGALSLWGYTTKRDISGWGSFLFMGLVGIILASLVNIFLQSSGLQFAISVIGVLVFAGLTAYDTQRIKDGYYDGARRCGHDGQERHHGRAEPLPRLHQHVHHAAQPLRQPQLSEPQSRREYVKSPGFRGSLLLGHGRLCSSCYPGSRSGSDGYPGPSVIAERPWVPAPRSALPQRLAWPG